MYTNVTMFTNFFSQTGGICLLISTWSRKVYTLYTTYFMYRIVFSLLLFLMYILLYRILGWTDFYQRRWTIIAWRNLIFYFWSNIELTLYGCSFTSEIANYKEKIKKQNFFDLIQDCPKLGKFWQFCYTLNSKSFCTKIYLKNIFK